MAIRSSGEAGVAYLRAFFAESARICGALDCESMDVMAELLSGIRDSGGRLFLCGSGGGAGHASHAACDFRKLTNIESYSVTDNVSELSARVNDDGWPTAYSDWLRVSRFGSRDGLFVFSVGGGDAERGVSENLVSAMQLAKDVGAKVMGVAGRDGGFLKAVADACVVIPVSEPAWTTTQVEGFQALVWHALVQHPALQRRAPHWESLSGGEA